MRDNSSGGRVVLVALLILLAELVVPSDERGSAYRGVQAAIFERRNATKNPETVISPAKSFAISKASEIRT